MRLPCDRKSQQPDQLPVQLATASVNAPLVTTDTILAINGTSIAIASFIQPKLARDAA